MRSARSMVSCSGTSQQKRILMFMCLVIWFAIFFVSGTLFVRRRSNLTDQLASLSSSFQEQISILSEKVSEQKGSAEDSIKSLHEKMKSSVTDLDNKIQELKKEIMEKRQKALDALHALHGVSPPTSLVQKDQEQKAATPPPVPSRSDMRSNASPGMCVDSMEKPVGSELVLYTCHSAGGNQAWNFASNGRVQNKDRNFCLRPGDITNESSVITATCLDNDELQKWKRSDALLTLDKYTDWCLDFDDTSKRLMIKHCDANRASQHWLL